MGFHKQQKLDADSKTVKPIMFTVDLEQDNGIIFFIIEEVNETVLHFSQEAVTVL